LRALHPKRTAFTLALLLGGLHALWALLVAIGLAQALSDGLFRLHFIQPVFVIEPFQLGLALALVVLTSAVGGLVGWGLAFVWNRLHDSAARAGS
jgi:hypothetical protein